MDEFIIANVDADMADVAAAGIEAEDIAGLQVGYGDTVIGLVAGNTVERVAELAERHLVSMTEISLAWLLTKVTSPVVGATKKAHVDGAVNAVNLQLSPEEIQFLEETYQPHVLTGVMAQN